jgi:NADH:ubiquinone oxidoreductase subunit E
MSRYQQQSIARTIAVTSGVILALSVAFLILDYIDLSIHTPSDKARAESLEEAVKTDALVSLELTSERERQTEVSLARDSVNIAMGWIVLICSALFVTGMKWLNELRGESALSKEKLVALRAAPSTTSRSKTTVAQRTESVEEDGIDLSVVDEIIAREGRTSEAAIPILRAIQTHFRYLPDEALRRVCESTEITPAQIAGTSSFYSQFRRSPVGKHVVKVCHGTACHVSGIVQISEEMHRYLSIPSGDDTDPRKLFTLDRVACLGCCSLAPVMMIDEHTVGKLTPAIACEALHETEPGEPQ